MLYIIYTHHKIPWFRGYEAFGIPMKIDPTIQMLPDFIGVLTPVFYVG